jgi:hypothetical protein
MDAITFRKRGEALFGPRWQTDLAKALGRGRSTIYRYAESVKPIPRSIELAMDALRVERIREIEGLASAPGISPPNEPGSRGADELPRSAPQAGR